MQDETYIFFCDLFVHITSIICWPTEPTKVSVPQNKMISQNRFSYLHITVSLVLDNLLELHLGYRLSEKKEKVSIFNTIAYRLLDSGVVECWLRVREVPASIPSQGPRHTKDVITMVPIVPLFSSQHLKGYTGSFSRITKGQISNG